MRDMTEEDVALDTAVRDGFNTNGILVSCRVTAPLFRIYLNKSDSTRWEQVHVETS